MTRRATPTSASPRRSSRHKADGDAPLVHRVTAYSKAALWDGVETWFDGGKEVSGEIDPKAAAVHTFKGGGGSNWEIWPPKGSTVKKVPLPWSSLATPAALDDITFGYKWAKDTVTKDGALVTLPEYYRLEKEKKDKEQWVVVNAKDVPAETGLAKVEFPKRPSRQTRTLRHARRDGELLEEAGAEGRAVRGEAG